MSIDNPFHLPWKVMYCGKDNIHVYGIYNCHDAVVVETDGGMYPPDRDTAEFIVKCVNWAWEQKR